MKYIFVSFFLLTSLPALSSGLDIPLFGASALPGVAAVPETPVQQQTEKTTPNIGIQAESLPELTVAPGISIPISSSPTPQRAVPFREKADPLGIQLQSIPTEKPVLSKEIEAALPIQKKKISATVENNIVDTNIYSFDIDEFTLGVTPSSVKELAQLKELTIDRVDYAVQPFLENVLTLRCKKQGFYTQTDVKKCVRDEADRLEAYYVATIVLKRPERKETYTINFTSFLTDNQAYRIQYMEQGDHSLGFSVKDKAAKAARKKAFLDKIYETYGHPSNVADKIWGNKESLYLQASIPETRLDATLVLEDKLLLQQDISAAKNFFLSYIEDEEAEE